MPKKNSVEWKQLQADRYMRKKEINKKTQSIILGDELTPMFVSILTFGAAVP